MTADRPTQPLDLPGARRLDQRWLVGRIPRNSGEHVRKADRRVG